MFTNGISATLDSNQPKENADFRSGYSTINQIHVINQVIEKYAEYTKPLCMAFINYDEVFDSVETSTVMKTLRRQGKEEKYIKTLEGIYKAS